MAPDSVSFRITRSTEDLAQTIHTLSQRLVKLEQRLAAMELQLDRHSDPEPGEVTSLDNVERLLDDCRQLLALSAGDPQTTPEPVLAIDSVQNGEERSWVAAA